MWSGEGARISLASLERDAPFSAYPGFDRTFCLLGPHAVTLIVDGVARVLAPGGWTSFAGETEVAARVDAGPVRAINVMTERGLARHVVERACGPVDGAMLAALAGDAGRYDAGDLILPPCPAELTGSFLAVRIQRRPSDARPASNGS